MGSATDSSARTTSPRSSYAAHRLSREQVAALQSDLPPPVPKPNPEGRKTHGRSVDEHGKTSQEISGRDDDSAEVWRLLKAAGMSPTREPAATTHVEAKVAARMARRGIRHSELVVNNLPCRGLFGCDVLLPLILPEGCSLTVHGPNYRKTFTGGKQWSR